jgi:hypothetical protein
MQPIGPNDHGVYDITELPPPIVVRPGTYTGMDYWHAHLLLGLVIDTRAAFKISGC